MTRLKVDLSDLKKKLLNSFVNYLHMINILSFPKNCTEV